MTLLTTLRGLLPTYFSPFLSIFDIFENEFVLDSPQDGQMLIEMTFIIDPNFAWHGITPYRLQLVNIRLTPNQPRSSFVSNVTIMNVSNHA